MSGGTARQLVARFAFRGVPVARVQRLGSAYAANVLPNVLRREALERIQWHKAQGDIVVVVSGSLELYLRDWCRVMGVELICTELEAKAGRLTGRYVDGDCSGKEKVRRIRERYAP